MIFGCFRSSSETSYFAGSFWWRKIPHVVASLGDLCIDSFLSICETFQLAYSSGQSAQCRQPPRSRRHEILEDQRQKKKTCMKGGGENDPPWSVCHDRQLDMHKEKRAQDHATIITNSEPLSQVQRGRKGRSDPAGTDHHQKGVVVMRK